VRAVLTASQIIFVGAEVLTAVIMKNTISRDVTRQVVRYRLIGVSEEYTASLFRAQYRTPS
jgi:hypothetical protein